MYISFRIPWQYGWSNDIFGNLCILPLQIICDAIFFCIRSDNTAAVQHIELLLTKENTIVSTFFCCCFWVLSNATLIIYIYIDHIIVYPLSLWCNLYWKRLLLAKLVHYTFGNVKFYFVLLNLRLLYWPEQFPLFECIFFRTDTKLVLSTNSLWVTLPWLYLVFSNFS